MSDSIGKFSTDFRRTDAHQLDPTSLSVDERDSPSLLVAFIQDERMHSPQVYSNPFHLNQEMLSLNALGLCAF